MSFVDKHISLSSLPEMGCWLKSFSGGIYSSRNFTNLLSGFLFRLRNFFCLISYINNADFSLFLLNHLVEEKTNRIQECLNMSLGEMLQYMCLLLGELNHSVDSLTAMAAMGASTLLTCKHLHAHTKSVFTLHLNPIPGQQNELTMMSEL